MFVNALGAVRTTREATVSTAEAVDRSTDTVSFESERGMSGIDPQPALKALAHPARWTMMELIHRGGGEICVCEFQEHLDLSQPTISHHLKTLREAGLIESRREGTWVYHTIRRDAAGELAEIIARWARPGGGKRAGRADVAGCSD